MAQRQEDEEIQANIDDYEANERGYDWAKIHYAIDDYEAIQSGYEKKLIPPQYCPITGNTIDFVWVTPDYSQTNILLEKREKKSTKTSTTNNNNIVFKDKNDKKENQASYPASYRPNNNIICKNTNDKEEDYRPNNNIICKNKNDKEEDHPSYPSYRPNNVQRTEKKRMIWNAQTRKFDFVTVFENKKDKEEDQPIDDQHYLSILSSRFHHGQDIEYFKSDKRNDEAFQQSHHKIQRTAIDYIKRYKPKHINKNGVLMTNIYVPIWKLPDNHPPNKKRYLPVWSEEYKKAKQNGISIAKKWKNCEKEIRNTKKQ